MCLGAAYSSGSGSGSAIGSVSGSGPDFGSGSAGPADEIERIDTGAHAEKPTYRDRESSC